MAPPPDAVDPLSAALLGVVQGLTEFLPVSSSGHIATLAHFFGIEDAGLTLSIVLHLGTLVATLLLLHRDVLGLFGATFQGLRSPRTLRDTPEGRLLVQVVLASVPTAALGLLLKDPVEDLAQTLWVVGLCFLVSAALVWSTRLSGPAALRNELTLQGALVVGIAQGIAVLPGISRSGTTIAVAMMLGLSGAASFRFSFLLSLPAVGGAVLLLLVKDGAFAAVPAAIWLGGAVAFGTGIGALLLLRRMVDQGRFWGFALYLVPLGLGLLAYDFFTH